MNYAWTHYIVQPNNNRKGEERREIIRCNVNVLWLLPIGTASQSKRRWKTAYYIRRPCWNKKKTGIRELSVAGSNHFILNYSLMARSGTRWGSLIPMGENEVPTPFSKLSSVFLGVGKRPVFTSTRSRVDSTSDP